MILTEVYARVSEIEDLDGYHVETCLVKSDDLTKRILRVHSDHGHDYGIRLNEESEPLSNGAAFQTGPRSLVVIQVRPDEMIRIRPQSMDEMGWYAHMIGNLHKPVMVRDAEILLLFDPVVASLLEQHGVAFEVCEAQLDLPLRHVDLSQGR